MKLKKNRVGHRLGPNPWPSDKHFCVLRYWATVIMRRYTSTNTRNEHEHVLSRWVVRSQFPVPRNTFNVTISHCQLYLLLYLFVLYVFFSLWPWKASGIWSLNKLSSWWDRYTRICRGQPSWALDRCNRVWQRERCQQRDENELQCVGRSVQSQ